VRATIEQLADVLGNATIPNLDGTRRECPVVVNKLIPDPEHIHGFAAPRRPRKRRLASVPSMETVWGREGAERRASGSGTGGFTHCVTVMSAFCA